MIIRTIEEERERLLDRARRNEAAALANAERRGEQRGEQRGERNKSLEIARRMRARGDDVNFIAEMTALTTDEVLKL